jgi:hypothetical protein
LTLVATLSPMTGTQHARGDTLTASIVEDGRSPRHSRSDYDSALPRQRRRIDGACIPSSFT